MCFHPYRELAELRVAVMSLQPVDAKGQPNAKQKSAGIGQKIHPLSIAIHMGLDQFDEAAVERKTEDDQRPSPGFAQCGWKGERCVGNEMMGFIGTWNLGKRVEGM